VTIELGEYATIDWTVLITSITDNFSTQFTKSVISDPFSLEVAGTYSVTVRVMDQSGNYTDQTFAVFLVDTTNPVITTNNSLFISGVALRTAFDGASGDLYGVSVDADRDYYIVGSPQDNSTRGSAYLYKFSDPNFVRKITAYDMAINDFFGISVAIYDDFIAIGSYRDNSSRGAVYIYRISDENYVRKITGSDIVTTAYFGLSVDIDGDYVIVGAPYDSQRGFYAGAAYLYKLSDDQYERKIVSSDGDSSDNFGTSVSISNGFFVIGAERGDNDIGSAYLYNVDNINFERKITPLFSNWNDGFGNQVKIRGNDIVIGARDFNDNRGVVFIYKLDDPNFLQYLYPNELNAGDFFGSSIDFNGELLVIGAYGDNRYGTSAGSIYTYNLNTLEFIRNFGAISFNQDDMFGFALAVSNDKLIVSSSGDDDRGLNSGSVSLFDILEGVIINVFDSSHVDLTLTRNGQNIAYPASGFISGSGTYVVNAVDSSSNSSSKSFTID
jgi:hypothetical protein